MLKYTITKSVVNNGTKDKWYGRIVYDETIDMDGLAEHMRQHNIPYTKGQLKGVMADLVRCIYELTTAGKKVKLPDLGIFRIKTNSKGAQTAKECTIDDCLRNKNLSFRSSGAMRSRMWGDDRNSFGVKWKQVEYVVRGVVSNIFVRFMTRQLGWTSWQSTWLRITPPSRRVSCLPSSRTSWAASRSCVWRASR